MKKLFFPLLMFAAAMSSCATDEVDSVYSADVDYDNLLGITAYTMTASTKGTDTTTSSLATDSGYVELYIDDADNVASSYTFAYTSGDWLQDETTAITWDNVEFPAKFYSLHDGKPITLEGFDETDITCDYDVEQESSTNHQDLVYHASVLNAIPTGGSVNVYHKHALSKIHLYAMTGTNNVYVARARLVYVDQDGTVKIVPLDYDEIATETGASWDLGDFTAMTYLYHYIGDDAPEKLTSTTESDPLINDATDAPLMIIPQSTTAATVSEDPDGLVAKITEGTYVELIYYMTDSKNIPLVGYSSVSVRSDASDYIEGDQGKTLYVMAAFPLKHEFTVNNEYDLKLGLGAEGSTGGKLIADYYVDKDGIEVDLTTIDGCDDTVEIPEIDEGDDILGSGDDDITIIVTATSWTDGGDKTLEQTTDEVDE